jgi:hypothetical protein
MNRFLNESKLRLGRFASNIVDIVQVMGDLILNNFVARW